MTLDDWLRLAGQARRNGQRLGHVPWEHLMERSGTALPWKVPWPPWNLESIEHFAHSAPELMDYAWMAMTYVLWFWTGYAEGQR